LARRPSAADLPLRISGIVVVFASRGFVVDGRESFRHRWCGVL